MELSKALIEAGLLYRILFLFFCCWRDVRKSVDLFGELVSFYMNKCGVLFFFMTGVEHISSTRFMSVKSKKSCFLQSFGRQKDRKPYLGKEINVFRFMCEELTVKPRKLNGFGRTDAVPMIHFLYVLYQIYGYIYICVVSAAQSFRAAYTENHTTPTGVHT